MGTQFKDGDKPENRITISQGRVVPPSVDDRGNRPQPKAEAEEAPARSFAQPNPLLPPRKVEPKAHASAQEEAEALAQNSQQKRKYERKDEN